MQMLESELEQEQEMLRREQDRLHQRVDKVTRKTKEKDQGIIWTVMNELDKKLEVSKLFQAKEERKAAKRRRWVREGGAEGSGKPGKSRKGSALSAVEASVGEEESGPFCEAEAQRSWGNDVSHGILRQSPAAELEEGLDRWIREAVSGDPVAEATADGWQAHYQGYASAMNELPPVICIKHEPQRASPRCRSPQPYPHPQRTPPVSARKEEPWQRNTSRPETVASSPKSRSDYGPDGQHHGEASPWETVANTFGVGDGQTSLHRQMTRALQNAADMLLPAESTSSRREESPPRTALVKVELRRDSTKKKWGLAWEKTGFKERKDRVVERLEPDSVAERWNRAQHEQDKPELKIQAGDRLISVNGKALPDEIKEALQGTEVVLEFRRTLPRRTMPTDERMSPSPDRFHGATPGFHGATPGYVGATPGYQGATPGYLSGTPGVFGATPGYHPGATPGYLGATPGYLGATPGYHGATPGYHGATPAQHGATPGLLGGTPGYHSIGMTPGQLSMPGMSNTPATGGPSCPTSPVKGMPRKGFQAAFSEYLTKVAPDVLTAAEAEAEKASADVDMEPVKKPRKFGQLEDSPRREAEPLVPPMPATGVASLPWDEEEEEAAPFADADKIANNKLDVSPHSLVVQVLSLGAGSLRLSWLFDWSAAPANLFGEGPPEKLFDVIRRQEDTCDVTHHYCARAELELDVPIGNRYTFEVCAVICDAMADDATPEEGQERTSLWKSDVSQAADADVRMPTSPSGLPPSAPGTPAEQTTFQPPRRRGVASTLGNFLAQRPAPGQAAASNALSAKDPTPPTSPLGQVIMGGSMQTNTSASSDGTAIIMGGSANPLTSSKPRTSAVNMLDPIREKQDVAELLRARREKPTHDLRQRSSSFDSDDEGSLKRLAMAMGNLERTAGSKMKSKEHEVVVDEGHHSLDVQLDAEPIRPVGGAKPTSAPSAAAAAAAFASGCFPHELTPVARPAQDSADTANFGDCQRELPSTSTG